MSELKLEFRNEKGEYLFEISGSFAQIAFGKLKGCPEFKHTKRKIEGKGEYVVLECIKGCGYKLSGVLEFILKEGAYIKCYF